MYSKIGRICAHSVVLKSLMSDKMTVLTELRAVFGIQSL